MKKKENWLRLTFWIGAFVDAAAALMLTFPAINTLMTGLPPAADSPVFRNTNATAAALMWGWTVLLIWASYQPVQRKNVMTITLVPVLSWLIGERIIGLVTQTVDPLRNFPLLILQFAIFALAVFSLWIIRDSKDESGLKKSA
jgi:hypothetical protein